MEALESKKSALPAIPENIPATIKSKFNITLTEVHFQELANEAHTLVFIADNVEKIKEFIKKGNEVEKAINKTHKEGKEPSLKICNDYDLAKRAFLVQKEFVFNSVEKRYSELCKKIEEETKKQKLEEDRKANIQLGIENNAVDFAKRISDCTTTKQLTYIESLINLEKSRKEKYAEFLPDAITRFNELNAILKTQKENVRLLEKLEAERIAAEKAGNEQAIIDIQEKQEAQAIKIEENKVEVQEKAIEQSMNYIPEARAVFTEVKARRTTWKYQMVNEKEVMKKAPELLIVSLNDDLVKATLKALKDNHILDGKTEYISNGIRYFEEKLF